MLDLANTRERMVDSQIAQRGIRDQRVLGPCAAFLVRHLSTWASRSSHTRIRRSLLARGRGVPQALKDQLAVGGRLIIPIGEFEQSLLKITRKSETEFEQEDLGAVMFVPLVSESERAGTDGTAPASPVPAPRGRSLSAPPRRRSSPAPTH